MLIYLLVPVPSTLPCAAARHMVECLLLNLTLPEPRHIILTLCLIYLHAFFFCSTYKVPWSTPLPGSFPLSGPSSLLHPGPGFMEPTHWTNNKPSPMFNQLIHITCSYIPYVCSFFFLVFYPLMKPYR